MIYDRDHYRERCSVYAILTIILFAIICLALPESAFPTTVTGTVKVQGQPLTGFVDVSLVYPATTGSYIALPGSMGHLPVTNGSFDALNLEGNDTLLPRGTYYQFLFSDAYGTGIARLNYVITGASFDIGTAVPTPVTTNNVNFLDLIGIRNLSTTNLTVLGTFNLGTTGTALTTDGINGAKQVNGVRYAGSYTTGSSTCGVAEAMAALPTAGGTIYLPLGTCTAASTISITKNVALIGFGIGATTIINQSGGDLFSVGTAASLSNFSVGGTGAGGNGVNFSPTSGSLIGASITNVNVTGQAGAGIFIGDNVQGLSIRSCVLSGNTGPGIKAGSALVASSGLSIRDTVSTGNTGDGVLVSGGQVTDVSISNSVLTSNTGNGVNVAATATLSTVHVLSSTITDNHQSGLLFAGGSGHTLDASTVKAGAHQLFGLSINYAGTAGVTQLEVKDSNITTNLTNDLVIGALTTGVVLYPPTVALASMNNSINPSAGVTFVVAQTTPPTPTCTGTGCWVVRPDGFTEQWGTVLGCTTAGSGCSVAVAFPRTLTSTANITITTSCTGGPTNCIVNPSAFTTTGFTATFDAAVRVGGSGTNLNGSQSVIWHSIGK